MPIGAIQGLGVIFLPLMQEELTRPELEGFVGAGYKSGEGDFHAGRKRGTKDERDAGEALVDRSTEVGESIYREMFCDWR